jgi:hypothetical protein
LRRSRRSSAWPPEFFVDRCLGKGTPARLLELGWVVHLISDHFTDDAQDVSDPEWIQLGLSRRWSMLTQDLRIRTQPEVHRLLRAHTGTVFCLSSAELPVRVRADRFQAQQASIYQRVRDGTAGFFVVTESGVVRRRL